MARLWSYLQRYRGRYTFGLACLLATGTMAMAVPYLLKHAVDSIAAGGPPSTAGWLAIAIIAIAALQAVARTLSRFVIFNVGRDVEYDLRNDLFAHLERLPLSYYQSQQTGDLMSRLVNDITAVRMLLGVGGLNLINTPIYYVYAVTIMVSLDWRLTLAALTPYPLVLLVVKRTSRQLMERTLKVQEGLAAMSSRVQENLSGIHVVKAYVREAEETEAFARLNAAFSAQNMELARVRGMHDAGDAGGEHARDAGRPLVRRPAGHRRRSSASATWWPSSATSTSSRGRPWRSAGCSRSCSAGAPPCSVWRRSSRPSPPSTTGARHVTFPSCAARSRFATSTSPTTRRTTAIASSRR